MTDRRQRMAWSVRIACGVHIASLLGIVAFLASVVWWPRAFDVVGINPSMWMFACLTAHIAALVILLMPRGYGR